MDTSPSAGIANIGARERRKRLGIGVAAFVAGAAIATMLIVTHAPLVWRLPLFLPFYAAALGFFQARDKTWVRLASRGLRDMDTGPQPIADPAELEEVRRQGRAVYIKSIVTAALLTALVLIM